MLAVAILGINWAEKSELTEQTFLFRGISTLNLRYGGAGILLGPATRSTTGDVVTVALKDSELQRLNIDIALLVEMSTLILASQTGIKPAYDA